MASNHVSKIADTVAAYGARLIAVSKTKPAEAILQLYEQGFKTFGENRVQELVAKHQALPKDIEWHLIGHLQTNKVKQIASFIHTIHSIDSWRLLEEVNRQAQKEQRVIHCLIQFKVAAEDTKYGFSMQEVADYLRSNPLDQLPNVRLVGVMGMATFTDDSAQIRREFETLRAYFRLLQTEFFSQQPAFRELSMGMSGDYQIALETGSTMVRIGSLIFGER